MIRQFTFSAQSQTLVVNYDCINGFIVNPNQSPLVLIFVDENYLKNTVSIPPLSRVNFKNLRIREINLVSGSGYIIFSPNDEMISDMSIQSVNIANVAKVTFSGLQSVAIDGVVKVTFSGQQNVNINGIVKVTFSGSQSVTVSNSQLDVNITNPAIKISNSTFSVNLLNSVVKVTFSGTQSVNANITNSQLDVNLVNPSIKISNSTFDVNLLNSVVKVTFSGTQNINANITNSQLDVNITNPSIKISNSTFSVNVLNSVIKVTFSGIQEVNANITNSQINANIVNPSIRISNSTFSVNVLNSVLKVTFSSVQNVNANITNSQINANIVNPSIRISNSTFSVNVLNSVIKVTFSGIQEVNANITNSQINANIVNPSIKISNSTFSVNVLNSVLKVTFSSVQNVNANITNSNLNVNVTNASLKVTFGSAQSVNANITNSVLKVTFGSAQSVNANITNSQLNVNVTNASLKVTFGSAQSVNANITNSVLKVTFSGTQTINANITNASLKVTFSGTQNINIVNSQINTNISGSNVLVPTTEIHGDINYKVIFYESLGGPAPYYFGVQFTMPPQSALRIKSLNLYFLRVFKPQMLTNTSLVNISENSTVSVFQSFFIFNQMWQNSSFCQNFVNSNGQILYAVGDVFINMAKNAYSSTTASICQTYTSKWLLISEKNIDYTLLNVGSNTFSFYIEYLDNQSSSTAYTPTSYWNIDYQVLFGSPSVSTFCNICSSSSSSSGGGGCFDEDTLFLTDKGKFVKIKDLKKGMKIWNGEEFVTVLSDPIFMGYDDVYLVDGIYVTASQPICFKMSKPHIYLCMPLEKYMDLSKLEKKEKRPVYDIIVEKRLIKKGRYYWLDILQKT